MSRTIGNIEKLTNEGQTQQQQQQQQQHEKSHDMSSVMKDCAKNTYMDEVSIIDNMASFLEANGCANIDQSILRNMAEALAKNINDTNPGILQDATMDNTYGVGYRSPCVSLQQYHGSTSPAVQGRSVREFEEHTAALRKENFNLKLRLYFIEENIPALKSNGADGCDTAMRELIEHKVEVEMLRRELEEKKAVLKDALQAIEDMEKFQKETETSYEAKMDDLKQKIQFLEVDRNVDKSESSDFMNNVLSRPDIVSEHVNNIKRIRELETLNKSYEDTISELENKVTFLDGILAKRDHTIKEFEDKIKSLEYRNAELQEELDEKKQDNASNEALNKLSESSTNHYLEKCLRDARNQQETISNLQTSCMLRVQNSERLLDRFREFEKCIEKMREEQNIEKKKNRFLCTVINKLRSQIENQTKMSADLTSSEEVQRSVIVETYKRVTNTATTTTSFKKSNNDRGIENMAFSEMMEDHGRRRELNLCNGDSDNDNDVVVNPLSIDAACDTGNCELSEFFAETFSSLKTTSQLKSAAAAAAVAASGESCNNMSSTNFTWVGDTNTNNNKKRDNSTFFIIVCTQGSTNIDEENFTVDVRRRLYESYPLRIWPITLKYLCYPIWLLNLYLRIGHPSATWIESSMRSLFGNVQKRSRNAIMH